MAHEKYLPGNTAMLILKLLESRDMYGYQIIEELAVRSEEAFKLKTGTLYPVLHSLENAGMVSSYDEAAGSARIRKYYKITKKGKGFLDKKEAEWEYYAKAVSLVLKGGAGYGTV